MESETEHFHFEIRRHYPNFISYVVTLRRIMNIFYFICRIYPQLLLFVAGISGARPVPHNNKLRMTQTKVGHICRSYFLVLYDKGVGASGRLTEYSGGANKKCDSSPYRVLMMLLMASLSVTLFSSGCGMLPLYTHRNALEPVDWLAGRFQDSQYKGVKRAEMVDWTDFENKDIFIGVAISGGGSRAANFGIAVLRELEELGILKHVNAISSVSGGSLAAAYYGLFKDTAEWKNETTVRKRFATDFFRAWQWRLFYPHNLARYFFTGFDRSDLMAEVFDNMLFKEKTFSDLSDNGPRIFINATNAVSGQPFHFSNQFFKCLESDLSTYPLSQAVMASGAFPLIFQNVTLRDYSRSWGRAGPRRGICDPNDTIGISRPMPYEIQFDDIRDSEALATRLLTGEDAIIQYIRNLIPSEVITSLENHTKTADLPEVLLKVLNGLVFFGRTVEGSTDFQSMYDPEIFSRVTLARETKRLLKKDMKDFDHDAKKAHIKHVNRLLLADIFSGEIRRVSRERYIHLFDGGSSENLGIETLREAAMYYFRTYFAKAPCKVICLDDSTGKVTLGNSGTVKTMGSLIGYGARLPPRDHITNPSDSASLAKREDISKPPGCLIISIDAHVNPLASEMLYQSDPRGWIDFLFDRNAINATDTLLRLRRDDVLRVLNIEPGTSYDTAIHTVDILSVTNHGESDHGKCVVWHISFSRLYDLYKYYRYYGPRDGQLIRKAKLFHFELADAIQQIETHYKLRGPKGCSPKDVQDLLFYAAHALVHDDAQTLEGIYSWFEQRGVNLEPRPDINKPLLKNIPIAHTRDSISCAK